MAGFDVTGILSSLRLRREVEPEETVGAPGFQSFGGFLQLNEKDAKLIGEQRYREFSDLLANTPIVAASVRYFLNLLAKSGWNMEPADKSQAAKDAADWLWEVLNDMDTPFSRVVRRSGMFPFHGFSVQEWTAKRRSDGTIGLLDIEPRPQITISQWDFDENGRVIGMVQRVPQNSTDVYLPRKKVVYLVDDAMSDTPIGIGLFRHLIEPSRRLAKYQLLEAFSFETNLRGIPIIKAPMAELDQSGLSADKKESILGKARKFVTRHFRSTGSGLLLDSDRYRDRGDNQTPGPPKWEFNLVTGDSAGQVEVAAAINRLNREMATVLGTEGLLLGNENGTQALSRDKSHSFSLRVEATQTEIAEGFEKDIRDVLWEINGFDDATKPRIRPDPIQFRDPEQLTGAIRDMATAGAVLMPGDPVINAVRSLLGLPEELETDPAIDALPRTNPIEPNGSSNA